MLVKIQRTVTEEVNIDHLINQITYGTIDSELIAQLIAVLQHINKPQETEYFKINMIKAAREAYSETVPGQIIGLWDAKNMIEAAIAANEQAIQRRQS